MENVNVADAKHLVNANAAVSNKGAQWFRQGRTQRTSAGRNVTSLKVQKQ